MPETEMTSFRHQIRTENAPIVLQRSHNRTLAREKRGTDGAQDSPGRRDTCQIEVSMSDRSTAMAVVASRAVVFWPSGRNALPY